MGSNIRKTVLEHLSLSGLLPIIRFSYGFALAAILSKQLTVVEYGQWSLFISNVFLALTIASVNLMYASSIILTGKEFPEQREDIFTVGLFKAGFTILVFLGLAGYLYQMDIFSLKMIGLMGLVLIFVNISNMVFGLLRALLRLKRQVLFFFIESALIILFVSISTFWLSAGLEGAIYAYLLAELIASSVGIFLLRQYLCWTRFSSDTIKTYLKIGIPLLPFAMSTLIVNSFVPLMIKMFESFEAVAVYSIAQKIALTVTIPNAIVNNIYAQYLKRSRLESGFAGVRRIFFKFVGGYISMTIPIFVILCFFGRDIIRLVSSDVYLESYDLLLVLASVNIIITLTGMLTAVFAVYNKTGKIGYIWLGVLVFYLIVNYLLVPVYGMQGISASLLITFSLGLVVVSAFALKMGTTISNEENN